MFEGKMADDRKEENKNGWMERRNKEWNQLIETTKTIIKITLYQELEETLNGNMLSQLKHVESIDNVLQGWGKLKL